MPQVAHSEWGAELGVKPMESGSRVHAPSYPCSVLLLGHTVRLHFPAPLIIRCGYRVLGNGLWTKTMCAMPRLAYKTIPWAFCALFSIHSVSGEKKSKDLKQEEPPPDPKSLWQSWKGTSPCHERNHPKEDSLMSWQPPGAVSLGMPQRRPPSPQTPPAMDWAWQRNKGSSFLASVRLDYRWSLSPLVQLELS